MNKMFTVVAMFLILVIPVAVAKVELSIRNQVIEDYSFEEEMGYYSNLDIIPNDMVSLMDDPFLKDILPKGTTSYAPYYNGKYSDRSLISDPTDTSLFMIGSVSVIVILPESNTNGNNTEDWTPEELAQVHTEITEGVNWWAAQEPNSHLEFNFTFYDQVNIFDEPILGDGADWWMPQAMAELGYFYIPGENNYLDPMYDLINDKRIEDETDWGFIIFVADSSNDENGRFNDDRFAFANLDFDGGGPYLVMTYDNDGYTINGMDHVTAHEMGHIFGALDQYAQSGCSPLSDIGYLNYENQNCANGGLINEPSIMKYSSGAYNPPLIDIYARGQVGWQDLDSDGILDIVDFEPTMDNYFANLIGDNFSIEGTSSSDILSAINPFYRNATVNIINNVEFKVNSGSWITANAIDGEFNEFSEEYGLSYSVFNWGDYLFEVKATDRFNQETNESNYVEVLYQSMGCIDSDVENDPKVFGNVSNYNGSFGFEEDTCVINGHRDYIRQFSCDGDDIVYSEERCNYGCDEGICLNKRIPKIRYSLHESLPVGTF